MSKASDGEIASSQDWFIPAIASTGSVGDCLDAVLADLSDKAMFVTTLRRALDPASAGETLAGRRKSGSVDTLTDLSQRIRSLENTLRFRLGILRPERAHAWFRAPAATSTGPFAASLLDEPVFQPYDPLDVERIRRELNVLWLRRVRGPLPFREDGPSLWRTLLEYGAELGAITNLAAPYEGLSLERLPDELPLSLASRSLRAFLVNVRNEVVLTRERLASCYRQLWDASEKLWALQVEQSATRRRERSHNFYASARARPNHAAAESVREEFKRRRQSARIPSHADREALQFMGFEEYPSAEILRQRYITMAKKLHPDLQGGNDVAFKTLSNAYALLSGRVDFLRY